MKPVLCIIRGPNFCKKCTVVVVSLSWDSEISGNVWELKTKKHNKIKGDLFIAVGGTMFSPSLSSKEDGCL